MTVFLHTLLDLVALGLAAAAAYHAYNLWQRRTEVDVGDIRNTAGWAALGLGGYGLLWLIVAAIDGGVWAFTSPNNEADSPAMAALKVPVKLAGEVATATAEGTVAAWQYTVPVVQDTAGKAGDGAVAAWNATTPVVVEQTTAFGRWLAALTPESAVELRERIQQSLLTEDLRILTEASAAQHALAVAAVGLVVLGLAWFGWGWLARRGKGTWLRGPVLLVSAALGLGLVYTTMVYAPQYGRILADPLMWHFAGQQR